MNKPKNHSNNSLTERTKGVIFLNKGFKARRGLIAALALALALVASLPTATENCFLFPELTAAASISGGQEKQGSESDGFIPKWFLGELLEKIFGF